MARKPPSASGYDPREIEHVKTTCLTMATKLGDLLDEIVIVGGLVPSLLIDQASIESAEDRHVGTTDLDLGLALSLLDARRYRTFSDDSKKQDSGRARTSAVERGFNHGESRVLRRSPWTS